jgi:hypothetical protein
MPLSDWREVERHKLVDAQRLVDRHRKALDKLAQGVPAEPGPEGEALERLVDLISAWPDVAGKDNRTLVGLYAAALAGLLSDMGKLEITMVACNDCTSEHYHVQRYGDPMGSKEIKYSYDADAWVVTE